MYSLRAELPGFKDGNRDDVSVASGGSVTVDFALRVCLGFGTMNHGVAPRLDELLTTSAVVHLRVAEAGRMRRLETDAYCGDVIETSATVLGVGRLARDEWRTDQTITLTSIDASLTSGGEYVAFLTYDPSAQKFDICMSYAWGVSNGRVEGLEELGIRDGTPVAQALTHLRDTYRRHTRYRQYTDLTSSAAIETLHYKTGWLLLGAINRNAWTDGYDQVVAPPFDFVATPDAHPTLPRQGDRIRLKEDGAITILDYGSRGEARRNISPTTRTQDHHITDYTGTRALASAIYTVADVQLEPIIKGHFVWVRVIAK
jgi:hypothetical protein